MKPHERLRAIAHAMREVSNGEQDIVIAGLIEHAIKDALGAARRIEDREDHLMRQAFGGQR